MNTVASVILTFKIVLSAYLIYIHDLKSLAFYMLSFLLTAILIATTEDL